jgi:hypothetical protein
VVAWPVVNHHKLFHAKQICHLSLSNFQPFTPIHRSFSRELNSQAQQPQRNRNHLHQIFPSTVKPPVAHTPVVVHAVISTRSEASNLMKKIQNKKIGIPKIKGKQNEKK